MCSSRDMVSPTTLTLSRSISNMITNTIIYLYVKQHSITGMKYFGMTQKQNPFKYYGSGTYWKEHIKKHGKQYVKTLEVWGFDSRDQCSYFSFKFSKDNNIVESKEWANLIPESGNKGALGRKATKEQRIHLSEIRKGKTYEEMYGYEKAQNLKKLRSISNSITKKNIPMSEEQKNKRRHKYGSNKSKGIKRGPMSKEIREKLSLSQKNRVSVKVICPNCHKEGDKRNMTRYHFSNCPLLR